MMNWLRRWARACVPKRYHPTSLFARRLQEVSQGVVMSGPFAGMRYVDCSFGSQLLPKLLGSYERELGPTVAELSAAGFEHIIVAGAAEGYYAVGMARWPSVRKVDAFEASPEAHAALAELARRNGVAGKIEQHGLCDCSQLAELLTDPAKTLLLVDIEGGEGILLDPAVVPALRQATMLVEIHDCFLAGLGVLMHERFASSHVISRIDAQPRTPGHLPRELCDLPRYLCGAAAAAIDEGRPDGMYWLLMRPINLTVAKQAM